MAKHRANVRQHPIHPFRVDIGEKRGRDNAPTWGWIKLLIDHTCTSVSRRNSSSDGGGEGAVECPKGFDL